MIFLKIWQTLQIWERLQMKMLIFKFLTGNASFLTPFKEAQNRFSISCLVCATELTQYTTYRKVNWVTLNSFY